MSSAHTITGDGSQWLLEEVLCDRAPFLSSLGEPWERVDHVQPFLQVDTYQHRRKSLTENTKQTISEPLHCEHVRPLRSSGQSKPAKTCIDCGGGVFTYANSNNLTGLTLSKTLRHDERHARSQYQLARQSYIDQLTRTHESGRLYFQCAEKRATDQAVIDALKSRLSEEMKELDERHEAVKGAEAVLAAVERLMAGEEDRADSIGISTIPPSHPTVFFDDNVSETSDSSQKTMPDVKQYFHVAGEVFVLRERLTELELDHEEAAVALSKDAVQSRSHSEQEERQYQYKRQELIDALTIARVRMNHQKEACLVHGMDPEQYRYRRISGQSHESCPAVFMPENDVRNVDTAPVSDTVVEWLHDTTNE